MPDVQECETGSPTAVAPTAPCLADGSMLGWGLHGLHA